MPGRTKQIDTKLKEIDTHTHTHNTRKNAVAGKKVWEVDCSFHVLKGPSKGRDAQSRNRVAGPQKKILLVSKLWHEATMHTGPKPIPD